jgi:hypothetical protein
LWHFASQDRDSGGLIDYGYRHLRGRQFQRHLTTANTPLTKPSTQTGVTGQTQTGTGVANPPCNATICDLYSLTVNLKQTGGSKIIGK